MTTGTITRRKMLGLLAGAAPLLGAASSLAGAQGPGRKRLGVGYYSYDTAWRAARGNEPSVPFKDAPSFLEYCHRLGAGGVQVALGTRPTADAAKLRAQAETYGMYIEGQVKLPQDESDLARFEDAIRTAKEAGARVVRAALLSGRRYETFQTADALRKFNESSWRSLSLSEPVLKKHRLRLAVENHKDFRVSELIGMLKRLSSQHVGACVDVGNNIALLEEPMAVVEALAPWAVSTHLKDVALAEYGAGFLLADVPLGDGCLDLPKMVAALRRAVPGIQFVLEMITRDPLEVPCLEKKYWATMQDVPGEQLAETLAMVRTKGTQKPLARVGHLTLQEKLKLEDDNVRKSLAYAHEHLAL